MSIWSIILKEIRHSRVQFLVGVLCIAAALGLVTGSFTLLAAHELNTERIAVEKERETREEMRRLEDDYRLMMRRMGYNVLVLSGDQSIEDLRMEGAPNTYMPLDYVYKLSTGGIEQLNHLFPVLQRRAVWPERDREMLLCGIMGQVPNFQKPQFLTDEGRYRNPIRDALPEGAIELGHDIARSEGIAPGDTVILFGESFTVRTVHPRSGNDDDVTVWCDLETMQGWFDLQGKINGILALECVCDFQQFGEVEDRVREVLPDTQVLEFGTILRARFDARARAAELHETTVDAEIAYRERLGAQRERLVRFLVPAVVLGAAIWVFTLILSNVKQRRGEIAIMRTVGVTQSRIMAIFLIKAALMGVAGAVIGCLAGPIAGAAWEGVPLWSAGFGELLRPAAFVLALAGAPILAVIAGWIPAMKAARIDPAVILRDE